MAFNISVFKFPTIDAANAAVAAINAGEGIPQSGAKTTTYAVPQTQDGYYYLVADNVTRQYLTGEETITLPDPVLVMN